jgi:uncharacterized protein YggE
MKRPWVLLFITASMVTSIAACSPAAPRTITVQGVGRVKFVPNQVEMIVSVEFTKTRLADAMAETKQVTKEVLALCRRHNIVETDVKTSGVSSGKEYRYVNNRQEFVGYRSAQSSSVLLRDIDDFERFSGDLLGLRVAGIERLYFSHSDLARFESEADLQALDDASRAADALLNRANVRKGRMIYVNNTAENTNDFDLESRSRTLNKNLHDSGIVLSPGILEVKKRVVVMYEIE